ncbi:prepilin-type N-terminal cleavage/methylation domain-containing protein [Candidatus Sumerlaeota bacterium]|nr:prepilin-type N-terminal cleavage/methylation domain-containing protein [Candidatus Sumerlaeota bacterium]
MGLHRRCGFTLIELLLTMGILLILSGIALDNYMAAAIRARVVRVKAEHRILAQAIEVYRIDQNQLPRMANSFYGDPAFDTIGGVPVSGVMTHCLSTPIAYVTNAYLIDPFMEKKVDAPLDERLYTYQVIPVYIQKNPKSKFWPGALEYYGEWRIGSVGTDLVFDHKFANSAQLPYDPTNGLVSLGNIWTSQKNRTDCPPVPALLGSH